jgi:glycerol kinase
VDLTELRVDGGMAASALFLQSLADLTGLPVTRPADLEMTALGAARVAALALGWTSLEAAAEAPGAMRFEPQCDPGDRAARTAAWARAVAGARQIGS